MMILGVHSATHLVHPYTITQNIQYRCTLSSPFEAPCPIVHIVLCLIYSRTATTHNTVYTTSSLHCNRHSSRTKSGLNSYTIRTEIFANFANACQWLQFFSEVFTKFAMFRKVMCTLVKFSQAKSFMYMVPQSRG